jgi:hypothetical protein
MISIGVQKLIPIGFSTLLFIIGLIVASYGVSLLNKDTTQKNKTKF